MFTLLDIIYTHSVELVMYYTLTSLFAETESYFPSVSGTQPQGLLEYEALE